MFFAYNAVRNRQLFQEVNEPHTHDEYEVLVCLSDGGTFYIGDRVCPLCRGMMIVVRKGIPHRCMVDIASYERYILHFPSETLYDISSPYTDFLVAFTKANDYIILTDEQLAEISLLFDRCMEKGTAFGDDIRRSIAFVNLILYITDRLSDKPAIVKPRPFKEYQKIVPVISYICDHCSQEINLDQLSQEFFISKYHLCRLFKAATGFSVGAYIINYRIRQASIMLRKGASVQSVGDQVGFNNTAHFIRTFRKIMGVPPGKYAREHGAVCKDNSVKNENG